MANTVTVLPSPMRVVTAAAALRTEPRGRDRHSIAVMLAHAEEVEPDLFSEQDRLQHIANRLRCRTQSLAF